VVTLSWEKSRFAGRRSYEEHGMVDAPFILNLATRVLPVRHRIDPSMRGENWCITSRPVNPSLGADAESWFKEVRWPNPANCAKRR
jgi:hypothetical protein